MTSTNRPVFSVVIPALQEEKYLERTLAQFPADLRSRFDFELIVSDGGSTDATVAIARCHADTVCTHAGPGRQTIAAGRNAGARAAKGEILIFLNADTIVEDPAAFFPAVTSRFANPEIAGATCPVCIYPEEERISDRIFHWFFNSYFHLLNIIGLGMGRGECQIVRRELFFEIGGYDEHLAAGEDFNLFVRLRRRGAIAYLRSHRVLESPRRFRRFGYRRILWLWFVNGISVLFRGRSISEEWEPVR